MPRLALPLAATLLAHGHSQMSEVTSLPGLTEPICWKHYSGYLAAPDGKKLFGWYHEAVAGARSAGSNGTAPCMVSLTAFFSLHDSSQSAPSKISFSGK